MIQVHVYRDPLKQIRAFVMEGHAYYADPGKDIVCAGATAVAVGAVNAVEELLGVDLHPNAESGLLEFELEPMQDEALHMKVQLLLDAMVSMLRTIERSYDEYIQIQEVEFELT